MGSLAGGIPTQSFNEGGSSSLVLTEYVSDTDDNGNSVPANTLFLYLSSVSVMNPYCLPKFTTRP